MAADNNYDSGKEHLGSVYAKALYGAAVKAGQADTVLSQLDSVIDDVFAKLPKFEAALVSPRVSHADKERMIDNAFRKNCSAVLLNTLKLMATKERLDCLRQLRRALRVLHNEAQGRIEVSLRTAVPLSNQLLERIRAKLASELKCDVDLRLEVRPEILGGLVVRVGDKLFDGSLVSQLEQVREKAIVRAEQAVRESLDRFIAG